jgi:predicted Holliday junction resolvase-like endonuclease
LDIFLSVIFSAVVIYLIYDRYFRGKKAKPSGKAKPSEIEQLIEREALISKENQEKVEKLSRGINILTEKNAKLDSDKCNIEILLKETEKNLNERIKDLESQLESTIDDKKKITSQKKSSEVRLGHIAETLAPFLDQFDFDPENCVFLGKPIDYISFSEDEITFIEVKSGKSQLNSKQRHIRDQVKSGLIAWKEIRIQ